MGADAKFGVCTKQRSECIPNFHSENFSDAYTPSLSKPRLPINYLMMLVFLLKASERRSFFFQHIQQFPEITTLSIILGSRITCPPVSVCLTMGPILHIRSQDSWNPTFASRYALRTEIRTVETKRDVNSARRRFSGFTRAPGKRRSEDIDGVLRRYGVLEFLLARGMHNGKRVV